MKNFLLRSFAITAAFYLVNVLQPLHAQELFKNGDFNATSSYYTTLCASVEASNYESTYGGTSTTNHVAEVDDESCFYQDVCILPGLSYTFSMDASRRSSGAPNPLTSHIRITGLDASSSVVATYVDMDFVRTNTTFAFTPVTAIPTISVSGGSGVVRLRIALSDNTTGYSTFGMIVDNLSLTIATPPSINPVASVCQNTTQNFNVNGVPTTGIYYAWAFGAGATPATSTIANPSVSWSSTGLKNISVALGNGICYVDTAYYAFTVSGAANYTVTDSICSDRKYVFGGDTIKASGTYVDSFVAVGGCDSIVTLNLYIKQVPSAPVITGDTVYCVGESFVPFNVTGSGLFWYTSATGGTGSATPPVPNTSAAGSETDYVSATNLGCEGPRSSITTTVYENPVADFTFSVGVGCARDTVMFVNNSIFATSFAWDFGDGLSNTETHRNPVHFYAPVFTPTDFAITLHAYNSHCSENISNQIVTLNPATFPRFMQMLTSDQSVMYGRAVQLDARGAQLYYWTPNNGSISDPNINNPMVTPADSTTYTVYGYNTQGCKDSASVHINVKYNDPILIPSGFTPNNDGLNDEFRIKCLKYTRLVAFDVFNKWGQLIFETFDISKGWDGTFNGIPQDIGVYKYLIITSESDGTNQTYKGDVTLIR